MPRRVVRAALLAATLLALPEAAHPAGRIAEATGPVQAREEGRAWSTLRPGGGLREGQTLRTTAASQAELDLGANRVGLDPATVLRIDSAHPAAPAFTLERGRAMFLLRSLQAGQEARIATPQATIALIQPGLYVVDTGGDGRPATVGVTRGLALAVAPGLSLMVSAGQTGVIGGLPDRPGSLRPGVAEGFLADDPSVPPLPQVVRPAMPPPISPGIAPSVAPPSYLVELPGGDALLREGQWVAVPEYGSVWYPPVAPGWSPYADPWGERIGWGYAPWHYGTWIAIGPRWGWLPPPRHHYPYHVRGHRPPPLPYPHGRPPPAVAQPNRPSPFWGVPPRPASPPAVAVPQPAAPAGPPSFWGRPSSPPAPAAPPPAAAPLASPAPSFWGRPQPSASPPQGFAPRPAPPPMMAPPPRPVAPPSAPAPARRCGFFGNPC